MVFKNFLQIGSMHLINMDAKLLLCNFYCCVHGHFADTFGTEPMIKPCFNKLNLRREY
jgi:hypothetical protein